MIIAGVWLNVSSDVSRIENVIICAVSALTISFLADFLKKTDEIASEVQDLKEILPPSRIESYESVDQVAQQLMDLVRVGKHDVDIVLYDTQIRSRDYKKINKMHEFMRLCADKKEIKMRLSFVPAADSINQRILNFIESEEKKSNSFYAYQYSVISFASFMVIDGKYISLRAPHKDGSKPSYCIVKEKSLCELYQSWFNILWSEAEHLDKENIKVLLEEYRSSIDNINTITRRLEKL